MLMDDHLVYHDCLNFCDMNFTLFDFDCFVGFS